MRKFSNLVGVAAQALAQLHNQNRNSATDVATLDHEGQTLVLRVCGIGSDAFFEWIDADSSDPIDDIFDDISLDSPFCQVAFASEPPKIRVHVDVDPALVQSVALDKAGYRVGEDVDQPGLYVWTKRPDGAEISFATAKEALEAAWADGANRTMEANNLSSDEWAALTFSQQATLITQTLSDESRDADLPVALSDEVSQ